ncbi:MAG TPA: hypothetical protein VKW78_06705 [Terriglobales bacterium]|nr:hypothetical protein [Terriglobales bacterium]
MFSWRGSLFSLLLLLCFSASALSESAPPDVSKTVNEVRLELVATDTFGRPVASLSPADIQVMEDGKRVHAFTLTPARDLPLLATLVYDTSESNDKSWRQMQPAVVNFLRQTITSNDQLWIAAFESKLQFDVPARGGMQFRRALSAPAGHEHLTAFNDSLFKTLRGYPAGNTVPHRAAMIVFSDGEDNYSIHSAADVITAAQRAKVTVYTIRRLNKRGWGNGGPVLHRLSSGTGGRDFDVSSVRDLEKVLETISSELRSCYLLYYPAPPNRTGSEFRTVSVTPRSKRVHIQAQAGYYMPVPATAPGD